MRQRRERGRRGRRGRPGAARALGALRQAVLGAQLAGVAHLRARTRRSADHALQKADEQRLLRSRHKIHAQKSYRKVSVCNLTLFDWNPIGLE